MSDNRKYITSTGLLLKSLNQEPMQSLAPPPQVPLPPAQAMHHHYSHSHPHHHQHHQPPPPPPQQQQQQHVNAYTSVSSPYSSHQQQPPYLLQHPQNFSNFSSMGGAQTNTVSSYLSQDLISRFPKKQTQQPPPPPPQSHQQQNVNKQMPKRSSTHQLQQQQAPPSSTVTELPETFGLPSDLLNKSKSKSTLLQHIPKYTTSSSSSLLTANAASSSSTNLEQLTSLTSKKSIEQQASSLTESSSAPSLAVQTTLIEASKKDTDIEIISEHYPAARPRQIQTNLQAKPTDEEYKQYLKSAYNLDSLLTLSTKPQCNFVSNLSCIDQLLAQCKYDETKKPFTVLKRVYNQINDDSESLSQDELNVCRKSDKTIKKQKLIVINDEENGGGDDDGKDEAHKPWITPQLLQLIKQRNLLQSKLNQQEEGVAANGEKTQPDPELLQKFKNLRNKVTKLVKNARKEYVVKIIKEKKEKETALAGTTSNSSITVSGGATSTKTADNAASVGQGSSGTSLQSALSTLAQQQPITQTQIQQAIASTHSSVMMNFYNTFFNQYMQQYTQHKLQKPAETGDSETDNYEYLKQQASYYAQQQHTVQTQLESCLSSTIQQFMNELSTTQTTTTSTTSTVTTTAPSAAATTTTAAAKQQQLPFNPTYHYNTIT